MQWQHGFVAARALHFDGEDGEEVGGKRRGRPWWRKGRRCGCSFSGACVRERGGNMAAVMCMHAIEYDGVKEHT